MKAIILVSLLLAGCEQMNTPVNTQPDHALEHQYFIECLKVLPPDKVDAAVIKECENAAYYQSLKVYEDKQK